MAESKKNDTNGNGKKIGTQAAMDKAVKSICDILRRDKAKGARLYVPELTWMFFLRYLDLIEQEEQTKAAALGVPFRETLASPYRWQDWAAKAPRDKDVQGNSRTGWKRQELTESAMGDFLKFVNDELFPYLKALKDQTGATNKQKVTSEIFISKEKTVVASETNLLNALDKP